jgi:hypothetical protein
VGNELRLNNHAFDTELTPTIPLTITATDAGGLQRAEDFIIQISDVNEPPTAIFPSGDTIIENVPAGVVTSLGLTVVDPDLGDSHTLTVSDGRFEIVNNQLKLKPGEALDFEAASLVSVDITATDLGGLSFTLPFIITVINANEHPAAVLLSAGNVLENTAGAVVGGVTVIDPDEGDDHTFSVSDSRFEVAFGQLQLKSGVALDYEASPTIALSITATDIGGLSRQQSFLLNVVDINEAPTQINLSNLTVSESLQGAVIGDLTVTDPDNGDSHTLSTGDARFEVVNGQLKLKANQSLDFETTTTTSVQVIATDVGGLSTMRSFVLTILDTNDAPTAVQLASSGVLENAQGVEIGELSASDPDLGDTHTFSTVDARFEIVGNLLRLRPGHALDFEAGAMVEITVTDSGSPARQHTQFVVIPLINENEGPTNIFLVPQALYGNSPGAVVGVLSVADPDANSQHTIELSDSRLEVNNGLLQLKSGVTLDPQTTPALEVMITARDVGNLSVSRTFTLDVLPPPSEQAFPWQNARLAFDVNNDGLITPLDAVLVINELNAVGPRELPALSAGLTPPPFFDVSGDGFISALDAVLVINRLNVGTSQGEGESIAEVSDYRGAEDAWMFLLSEDARRRETDEFAAAADDVFQAGLDWMWGKD